MNDRQICTCIWALSSSPSRVNPRCPIHGTQTDDGAGDPGGTPAHRGQQAGSIPASEPAPSSPRLFVLDRRTDVSGVSGTGVVAEGVRFTDGTVALRWLGAHPSTAVWPDLDEVRAVHGHDGATVVRWLEAFTDA